MKMDIDFSNRSSFEDQFESAMPSTDQTSNLPDIRMPEMDQIKDILILSQRHFCQNASNENMPICRANLSQYDPVLDEQIEFEYVSLVSIVVPIIFGIVVLVGVFGNTLVAIVIIVNKQMKSTTNYLIFSLAIADLMFTLFCVPFTASDYIFNEWPFGVVWCKVVQYLTYVTAYASVYTLLLLSIDRYFAVVHPIYAMRIRTERNAMYAIVFTWNLILSSCIPLYIVHGVSEEMVCTFLEGSYNHAAFHIGFITTMYFIPLTVIVGLYLLILQKLWSQSAPGGIRSAESVRGKKRVTRMVIVVIVTFIICWLPIQIVLLLKSLGMYKMTTAGIFVQISGQVLAYMNSCINPILYAFLSDPFRKAFRKVMSCGSDRRELNGRSAYHETRDTRPLTQTRQTLLMTTRSGSPSNIGGIQTSDNYHITTTFSNDANGNERGLLTVNSNGVI